MDTLLRFGLSNALMAAAMAVMVAALSRLCRRPALVHSLWLLVLLKLVTPPLWPVSLQKYLATEPNLAAVDSPAAGSVAENDATADVQPARQLEEQESKADPAVTPTSPLPEREVVPEEDEPVLPSSETLAEPLPASRPIPWTALVAGAWLCGSLLWFMLAGVRLFRFRLLLRSAQQVPADLRARVQWLSGRLGLTRAPQVLTLSAGVSPMLWALGGVPRLLLPASLLSRLSDEQWDTLLVHELAHLRRRDHWVRLMEMLVLGLYWWHPVVWWARRELREAEEQCCDAWVVWALPGSAEAYALALVETVTFLSQSRTALPVAASGIGHVHLLKRRLIMIMRGKTPRALSGLGILAVLGLGALLLPLLPTWAQSDESPKPGVEPPALGAEEEQGPGDGFEGQPGQPPSLQPLPRGRGGMPPGAASSGVSGRSSMAQQNRADQLEDARDEVELQGAQLQSKRAEMQEVKALLKQAQRSVERINRLANSGAIDVTEADRARTEVEVLEARLGGKQAQIQEAELRLRQAQRHLARLQRNERARASAAQGQPPQPAAGGGFPGMGPGPGAVPMMPGAGAGRMRSPAGLEEGVPRPGQPGMRGSAGPGGFTPQPTSGTPVPMAPGGRESGMFGARGGRGGSGEPGMPGAPPTAGRGGMGGMGGGVMGGGLAGGFRPGTGFAPADLERRLAQMENSLRALAEEVKSLRSSAALSKNEALLKDLVNELKRHSQEIERSEKGKRP